MISWNVACCGGRSAEEPLSFLERKSELDRLFFTDRDAIKKGTPVYDEFWKFYAKYQVCCAGNPVKPSQIQSKPLKIQ